MKIDKVLEEYLINSFDREEATHKQRKFYVSDMGKCMRVRWVKRKGVKQHFEPYVYWLLQLGNILHDYGYKVLESKGLLIGSEEYISDDNFSGRYDGKIKNGKKVSPFDFKSVGGYKMAKIIKGEDDEGNVEQVLTYLMYLQEKDKKVGDSAFLVYLNKEPSAKNPFMFFQKEYYLTGWRKKKIKEEMSQLLSYWEEDKIPPCTCPSWMKPYNSYQPFCSASEKQVREYINHLEDEHSELVSDNKEIILIKNGKKKKLG